jgi:hypothetical protein
VGHQEFFKGNDLFGVKGGMTSRSNHFFQTILERTVLLYFSLQLSLETGRVDLIHSNITKSPVANIALFPRNDWKNSSFYFFCITTSYFYFHHPLFNAWKSSCLGFTSFYSFRYGFFK